MDKRQSPWLLGAGLATTTALTMPALAADMAWTGTSNSDWLTGTNWSGSVPSSPTVAVINQGAGASPVITGVGVNAAPGSIAVGIDGSTATLDIRGGGTLTTSTWYDYIGGAVDRPVVAGSTGTVSVDGSGSRWTSAMGIAVGFSGTGAFNITNGGAVTTHVFDIGSLDDSVGTVTLDGPGSTLTATAETIVGREGTGTLTVSNGASATFATMNIGIGKIGATTHAEGTLRIESGSTASMSAAGATYLGNQADAKGTAVVTGSGSTWSVGQIIIGYEGEGVVTVENGATVSTALQTYLGYIDGSRSSLTITGAGSRWSSAGDIGIGVGVAVGGVSPTTGAVTVSDGGALSGPKIIVGWSAGTNGRLVVDGAGSTVTASTYLMAGNVGTGTVVVANGGRIETSGTATIRIGHGAGSVGKLIIGGETTAAAAGTVTSSGGVLFGAGSGQVIFNHTDTAYVFAPSISGAGSVLVESGTTTLSGTNTYTGGTTISGGRLVGSTTSLTGAIVNNATLEISQNGDGTFAGDISGTGNLVKSGTGTVTLTGALSYTGTTTILGGHLIGNTTVIGGSVTNDGVLEFDQGSNGTYASSVTGSGSLVKTGAGTLVLTGTNSYTGGTTISAGTLIGSTTSLSGDVVNQARLVFDQTSDGTFAGAISGGGTLTKSGSGTLRLTGASSYVGTTTVSAGILSVNGSITGSTVVIESGATLGGSGTVGGIIAASGSTVAPGNSIGTLSISGNASFASGSTYHVEVDGAGRSDKLAATGTVTIASTVALLVTPENGTDTGATYALDTAYTIITAGGGVTGTFATVSENFAYLTATVSYAGDGSAVYLTLSRTSSGGGSTFASLVSAPNGQAAARAVEAQGSGNALYQAASRLTTGEPERAFARLSGEIHPSIASALMDRSRLTRDVLTNRLRDAFGAVASAPEAALSARDRERLSVWTSTFGAWGRYDGDGNAHALDVAGGGLMVGADAPLDGGWRVGVALGFSHDRIGDDAVASSGSVDSYYLAGYGGTTVGPAALRFGAVHAFQSISTERDVAVSTLTDKLKADYDAGLSQVFAEGAWRYDVETWRVEPYANAAYVHLATDDFSESGGAAALSSSAAGYDQVYTTLGVRFEHPITLGRPVRPTAGLGWRHAWGDVADTRLRFAGSGAFGVAAAAVARDAVLVDVGIAVDLDEESSLSIRYNGMLADGLNDQAVAAKLGVRF